MGRPDKDVAAVHVEQFPFVLCAWPSSADQPDITDAPIYDDRVGEVTRFTHRPGRARPGEMPQERRGPILRLLLGTASSKDSAPRGSRPGHGLIVGRVLGMISGSGSVSCSGREAPSMSRLSPSHSALTR